MEEYIFEIGRQDHALLNKMESLKAAGKKPYIVTNKDENNYIIRINTKEEK